MPHYHYLIIGGGMTAAAAVSGIRQVDAEGKIGIIGQENHPPYSRPPLSKGLWKGKPLEKIWRRVEAQPGVTLHLGRKAIALDPKSKQVTDDQGTLYTYDKLLLATGGSPRQLPFGKEQIIYFRTLEDYQRLRAQVGEGKRFVVIGGGFIGSEIAAALASNGQKVTMIFPEAGIGGLLFPSDLSVFLNDYYREKGVQVLAGELVTHLEQKGEQLIVQTKSGQEILADGVVAGIGIQPNLDLARAAGLTMGDGIIVDEFLCTSHADVYAAGDVANFYNPLLERHLRVEHEDNANTQGKLAGYNMASNQPMPYHHLPFFYSDLFDLGYEAVGELNPKLEAFADWQQPYQKGVIYYLDQGRVRGVILWNVWGQVEAARQLIAQPGPFEARDLKNKIS